VPRVRIEEWLVLDVHDPHPIRFYCPRGVLLLSSEWNGQRVGYSDFCLFRDSPTKFFFFFSRTIRLPGDGGRPAYGGDTGVVATLASIPWFIVGIAGITYEWVASRVDTHMFSSRRGYRNLPIDEDAQILHFEDEE